AAAVCDAADSVVAGAAAASGPCSRPWRTARARRDTGAGLGEIFRFQFDRRAVRRAVGGVVPGVEIFPQGARVGDALLGDDALQRGKPMPVIGLAGIGIASGLRLLDLVAEDRRPFRPLEQASVVERQR